jgi:hypothetical protein
MIYLQNFGYLNPHINYPNFSLDIVYKQVKQYFNDTDKVAVKFNSIDICPQLGCVIGINGSKINGGREFEKELDHELNHYFEKMNIHFDLTKYIDKIEDTSYKNIINTIEEFYHINFCKKTSFIRDLKYHLFNFNEFRSMSANVFHEILQYNETHLRQLDFHIFLTDIKNCDYHKYTDINMQETILFCWLTKQLSENRWNLLLTGIKDAIKIRKNIFQKFLIQSKDILRKVILKIKGENKHD